MLSVFGIDAVQLQVSGSFAELHVDPAMRVAFAEIIADSRLVNKMKVAPLIMLPLMGVTLEISSGVPAFGKQLQQRGPVTHAFDRPHAAVGIRVEVTKDKSRLIRALVELSGEPVQLFVSRGSSSP